MREVFEDEELPPENERRDTEVTLGPMTVAGLIFGLLLLCGLCFVLGYSMGGHGGGSVLKAAQPSSPPATGASTKPGTAPQTNTPEQPAASTTSQPSGTGAPAAGGAPGNSLMVQVAVVSHHEDADVLVSALLKRGYAVALSQDAADGQFHVRVGPFANLDQANAMRQKLLNDGYNAVVQP